MRQKRKRWVKLSEQEKTILKNYFKYSPLLTVRLKAHVVLLKDAGISGFNVSLAIDRDLRTLERWIKDFSERRLKGGIANILTIFAGIDVVLH